MHEGEAQGVGDGRLVDGDDAAHRGAADLERQPADGVGAQPVGDGRAHRHRDGTTRPQRLGERRHGRRLCAHDVDAQPCRGQAGTGQGAAAANRHHDGVQGAARGPDLVDQLGGCGALARDDVGVLPRVDDRPAALGPQPLDDGCPLRRCRAVEHQLATRRAYGVGLAACDVGRQHEHGGQPVVASGQRDRDRVVSGALRDDARRAVTGQPTDGQQGAAQLERPAALEVLGLEPDPGTARRSSSSLRTTGVRTMRPASRRWAGSTSARPRASRMVVRPSASNLVS